MKYILKNEQTSKIYARVKEDVDIEKKIYTYYIPNIYMQEDNFHYGLCCHLLHIQSIMSDRNIYLLYSPLLPLPSLLYAFISPLEYFCTEIRDGVPSDRI